MPDTYTPFSSRPDWSDVIPIEQYEGAAPPLAPILYGADYKDATAYLRAIVALSERSPRALELTEAVVRMNPSHYTAWQYRYETLVALSKQQPDGGKGLIGREEELMDELAIKHMKSYQVWHHRRLILLLAVSPKDGTLTEGEDRRVKRELVFISRSFDEDSKNYHTWSYRQWVLAHFFGPVGSESEKVWAAELKWTEAMLQEDIRNNSAWHHRFFVVFERPGALIGDSEIGRELGYTKQSIALAPNNPSAWNYLRGVLDKLSIPYSTLEAFVQPYTLDKPEFKDKDVEDLDKPKPAEGAELPCAAALEFLADVYERQGDKDGVYKAVDLWKSLANEHDTIRRRYWEHRIREGIESLSTASSKSA